MVSEDRLCDFAEAYLHVHYKNHRVNNPSSAQKTEFFIPEPFSIPTIDYLLTMLRKANIDCELSTKLDKNSFSCLDSTHEYKKIPKSKYKDKSKVTKPAFITNQAEELLLQTQFTDDPLSFFKDCVLFVNELRTIQIELWNGLELINGIIKWPTGTGKRIAIMMIVIKLFLQRRRPIRIAIIANRRDILKGIPWQEYKSLDLFGIHVVKGFEGEFAKLNLDDDKSYLIVATHQSVIKKDADVESKKLKHLNLDAIIYDESQNITGSNMYEYLINNRPHNLIGISATPETDDPEQNAKVTNLFGGNLISECSYSRAIKEGWINDCKYHIFPYDNQDDPMEGILTIIKDRISIRISWNMWKTKKCMGWVPEGIKKRDEYKEYIETNTDWKVFDDPNDPEFNNLNSTDTPWCLLLCQKGREGYDPKGVEFGFTIGSSKNHLYVQEQGRCQRTDYAGQLSELLIFTNTDNIHELVEGLTKYMGKDYSVSIENVSNYQCKGNKTEEDIQLEQEEEQNRIEYEGRHIQIRNKREQNRTKQLLIIDTKEKQTKLEFEKEQRKQTFNTLSTEAQYGTCRQENITLRIKDDKEYTERTDRSYYKDNPEEYFNSEWKSWYDFLGIEQTEFPDKKDFIEKTRSWWVANKDPYKFSEKCKENNYPYFDYQGLYEDIPSDLFFKIDKGRRGR